MTSTSINSQVVKLLDPAALKLEYDLRALSPQIRDLIQKVKQQGKFTLVLVDNTRGGSYDPPTRQISINKNLQHHLQLACFIFELLNAERQSEFAEVDKEARLGLHSKETYGEAIERLEFENTGRHHNLVQGLPLEFDVFPYPSFPEYLKTNLASGHTQHYYRFYEQQGYPNYPEIDWSGRNDPVARLVGDLRAMPRNIIERIKNVERILGKFPTIVLVDDHVTRSSCYENPTRLIRLNKNLPHNVQLSFLIFELLHIERLADFGSIHLEALQGQHTENSYGAAFEKIEFENMIEHHRLVQGLPRECDVYRWARSMSLSEYLDYAARIGHTNHYHKAYRDSHFLYSDL